MRRAKCVLRMGSMAVVLPWRVSLSPQCDRPTRHGELRLAQATTLAQGVQHRDQQLSAPFLAVTSSNGFANRWFTSSHHLLKPVFSSELNRYCVGEEKKASVRKANKELLRHQKVN